MKSIGLARIGKDAELRYSPNGTAVCNLSLAVVYGMKQQDGNRPTQWIDAAMWGKQAEALAQYMVKGSSHCFTLDDVHIETFQRNDGSTGTKLVARVIDVELGPRVDNGGGQGQYQQQHQQRQAPPPQQQQQQMAPPPAQQQQQMAPPPVQQQQQQPAQQQQYQNMDDDK